VVKSCHIISYIRATLPERMERLFCRFKHERTSLHHILIFLFVEIGGSRKFPPGVEFSVTIFQVCIHGIQGKTAA
jgi:hypothetical protein